MQNVVSKRFPFMTSFITGIETAFIQRNSFLVQTPAAVPLGVDENSFSSAPLVLTVIPEGTLYFGVEGSLNQ